MKKNTKITDNKKSKKVYYVPTEPVRKIPVTAKSCIGISVEKVKEMKKSDDTYYIV